VEEPQRTGTVVPARPAPAVTGAAPQYTATQAAGGKTVFEAHCAACHGNTLMNGTFGPPLAGETFRPAWAGQSVRALLDSARRMPPASPGSLSDEAYAN